jgi:hypothetical protein
MLLIVVGLRLPCYLFVFFIAESGASNDSNGASNQSTFAGTILLIPHDATDSCSGNATDQGPPFGVRVRPSRAVLLCQGDICQNESHCNTSQVAYQTELLSKHSIVHPIDYCGKKPYQDSKIGNSADGNPMEAYEVCCKGSSQKNQSIINMATQRTAAIASKKQIVQTPVLYACLIISSVRS